MAVQHICSRCKRARRASANNTQHSQDRKLALVYTWNNIYRKCMGKAFFCCKKAEPCNTNSTAHTRALHICSQVSTCFFTENVFFWCKILAKYAA